MRHVGGGGFLGLGRWSDSRPQLKRALEIRRIALGDEHPDTLESMTLYATLLVVHRQRALTQEGFRLAYEAARTAERVYGPEHTGLWLASIDIRSGGQPENPYPNKKRVYREISSPRGSNLYWEQPAVVAAYHVSRLLGDERYAHASDR